MTRQCPPSRKQSLSGAAMNVCRALVILSVDAVRRFSSKIPPWRFRDGYGLRSLSSDNIISLTPVVGSARWVGTSLSIAVGGKKYAKPLKPRT